MIPSSYDYYNVPYQYRSVYPASASNGYWYAPGAIYQYDQSSSLITSVAALLSPGMTIGQPLPMGYNTYNVPYGYRTTVRRHGERLVPLQQRLHLQGRPDHPGRLGDRRFDPDLNRIH